MILRMYNRDIFICLTYKLYMITIFELMRLQKCMTMVELDGKYMNGFLFTEISSLRCDNTL